MRLASQLSVAWQRVHLNYKFNAFRVRFGKSLKSHLTSFLIISYQVFRLHFLADEV